MEEDNVSVGKFRGKKPLRSLHHRWETTVSMHIKEIGFEGIDWFQLVLGRGISVRV
jgi:hypothetical protein